MSALHLKLGSKFKFTTNQSLSYLVPDITVGKVYTIVGHDPEEGGGFFFIDDQGDQNFAASVGGDLEDFHRDCEFARYPRHLRRLRVRHR